jgi:predicted metalloenzyme YecM
MNTKIFNEQALLFLSRLADELLGKKLVLEPHWNIDHLCYRVGTEAEYQRLRLEFLQFSDLLIESPVNGRSISTFKLFEPLQFLGWQIDVVELPAPKSNAPTPTGFEHIEVVIDAPFSEIIQNNSHLEFDSSALAKDFNQELKVRLACGTVKFHQLSLESVVRLENNKPVFGALQSLGILNEFRDHVPLVAGTFPLGISTPTSDVDLLMCSENLKLTQERLSEKYSSLFGFRIEQTLVESEPTLLASFIFDNVPFEVFVQRTPSVRQRGYLHFLVEERLLKLGSSAFLTKIHNLREKGSKTEPAFAQALNLFGDPYETLLELQTQSELALKDAYKHSLLS